MARTRQIAAMVDTALLGRLLAHAEVEGRSQADVIRRALVDYLDRGLASRWQYGLRHPNGVFTVPRTVMPSSTEEQAAQEVTDFDRVCAFCDGGRHVVVRRAVAGWEDVPA